MGHHLPAATLACRVHGEAHEWDAEAVPPVTAENREPVTLPQAGGGIKRVQAHRTADDAIDEPDDVDHARLLVVQVTIVGGEDALLAHEDLITDRIVGRQFRRRRRGTAFQARLRGRAGPRGRLSPPGQSEAGYVHQSPQRGGRRPQAG